jgi:hypothetical protein
MVPANGPRRESTSTATRKVPRDRALVLALAVLACLTVACDGSAGKPIAVTHLVSDPGRFAGKMITLRGVVANAFQVPFVSTRFYVLKDETGSIPVLTERMVATAGTTVTVEGTIDAAAVVGGSTVGLHLRESARW